MSVRTSLVVMLVMLVGSACDAPAVSDDEQVVRDSLAALDSSSAQLGLYDGLLGPVNLQGISLALAPMRVIAQVRDGLDEALADRACLTIASDKQRFLDLRFADCRYKGTRVDGHLRIELDLELAPGPGACAGEPCVVATRYTTTLTDLAIGKTTVRSASSVLRVPEARSEPRSYVAEVELTDRDERALSLRHELAWLRAAGCVHAELGAELAVDGREISVGASGIEVCGGACPRAGRVQIAWDNGRALAWQFVGEPDLVVRGPRGREFVVEQACTADEP